MLCNKPPSNSEPQNNDLPLVPGILWARWARPGSLPQGSPAIACTWWPGPLKTGLDTHSDSLTCQRPTLTVGWQVSWEAGAVPARGLSPCGLASPSGQFRPEGDGALIPKDPGDA